MLAICIFQVRQSSLRYPYDSLIKISSFFLTPGYNLSYEDANFKYPPSFANPLKVIIEASNGASDYGNKFGEPVITGFAISYGQKNGSDEREEYVKPIMFSGGLGTMDVNFRKKMDPEKGDNFINLYSRDVEFCLFLLVLIRQSPCENWRASLSDRRGRRCCEFSRGSR